MICVKGLGSGIEKESRSVTGQGNFENDCTYVRILYEEEH